MEKKNKDNIIMYRMEITKEESYKFRVLAAKNKFKSIKDYILANTIYKK